MTEQTKTVSGYFGDKQITRADFIKQWTDHAGQLVHLVSYNDDGESWEEYQAMKAKIAEWAGARWDELKA